MYGLYAVYLSMPGRITRGKTYDVFDASVAVTSQVGVASFRHERKSTILAAH